MEYDGKDQASPACILLPVPCLAILLLIETKQPLIAAKTLSKGLL